MVMSQASQIFRHSLAKPLWISLTRVNTLLARGDFMTELEKTERKFLHDLASPLGTLILLLESLVDSEGVGSPGVPKDLVQKKQLLMLGLRMKKMIEERRAILIQSGVPPSTR
jgi:hypothetical protein